MKFQRQIIIWILQLLLWSAVADRAQAQVMDVPVDVQFPLFMKILTYDRNLAARAGDHIVLGILYQHTFKSSVSAKEDMVKMIAASKTVSLCGLPFIVETIDLAGEVDAGAALDERGIDIVYIAPLRAYDIESIVESTRQRRVLSLTGVSGYADRGVAITIGMANQRPQIYIKLSSAKAEGAEFNSHFLKLVKVLQ